MAQFSPSRGANEKKDRKLAKKTEKEWRGVAGVIPGTGVGGQGGGGEARRPPAADAHGCMLQFKKFSELFAQSAFQKIYRNSE